MSIAKQVAERVLGVITDELLQELDKADGVIGLSEVDQDAVDAALASLRVAKYCSMALLGKKDMLHEAVIEAIHAGGYIHKHDTDGIDTLRRLRTDHQ